MTRKEVIGNAELWLGDCREILPTIGKVDAVVTSPPYAQQRKYISFIGDKYQSLLSVLADTPCHAETQILVNLGLIYRDGFVIEYWEPFKRDMAEAMWRFFGWYVWDKGFGAPGNWNGRLAPAHEFIFHFNKNSKPVHKWVPTNPLYQGRKKPGTGLRKANGEMSGISSPEKCGQLVKVPDSVLRITPQQARNGIECEHPAVFPVELPSHLIKSFSCQGETIVDPFMGSGTTGVACVKLGRKFIGVEIEEKYFSIACRRIEQAYRQADLFIKQPEEKQKQETLFAPGEIGK